MNCRHCSKPLRHPFLDLGFAPPSNAYLSVDNLWQPEKIYPLRVLVCDRCWLVQTEDYAGADELFTPDYAYFSSTSTTWLEHAKCYSQYIIARLGLGIDSRVVEVASNDGYLLKNFFDSGIPCLGIEPTDSTAEAAEKLGIPVIRRFFGEHLGRELAASGSQADLIVGNNVFAHVPDINDFARGLKAVLKPNGTITLEFPHLMQLLELNQFDTVYHEHFSYLSLHAVTAIFSAAGLKVHDVEELSTHGGSLRIYGCHSEHAVAPDANVLRILEEEKKRGLLDLQVYSDFQARAEKVKNDMLLFLLEQKEAGKKIAAYGAAAKGNTFLNFAGINGDLISFVVDRSPGKTGKLLPGSRIPIRHEDHLLAEKPDVIVILPWNLRAEIARQLAYTRNWGARFAVALPELEVF